MKNRKEEIANLVTECFLVHQEAVLVNLILELELDYIELANLATMGEYKSSWTHKQVLDYITNEI